MRKWMNIMERWDSQIVSTGSTLGSYKPTPIDIFRNPSRTEFAKIRARSGEGSLRGLITTTNDLLVWDAMEAIHSDVLDHERYRDECDGQVWLVLSKDVMIRHLEFWLDESNGQYEQGLRSMVARVQANPSLTRIFGRGFVPVGENADDDEYFELTPAWMNENIS